MPRPRAVDFSPSALPHPRTSSSSPGVGQSAPGGTSARPTGSAVPTSSGLQDKEKDILRRSRRLLLSRVGWGATPPGPDVNARVLPTGPPRLGTSESSHVPLPPRACHPAGLGGCTSGFPRGQRLAARSPSSPPGAPPRSWALRDSHYLSRKHARPVPAIPASWTVWGAGGQRGASKTWTKR